jgi:hypothetical protein
MCESIYRKTILYCCIYMGYSIYGLQYIYGLYIYGPQYIYRLQYQIIYVIYGIDGRITYINGIYGIHGLQYPIKRTI